MAVEYLLLVLGLLILFFSGKYLVDSSVELAGYLKIPKMIIGLTVVAFGTSAPELLVSLQAALNGFPEIAVGNVVGSNISNILLVLAITAIIYTIPVPKKSMREDWPILMGVSLLFFLFIYNGTLHRWESICLLGLLGLYFMKSLFDSRGKEHRRKENETEDNRSMKWWIAGLVFIASVIGLAFGADILVKKAALIAEDLGLSKRVISISMVAIGTSIPEMATSLIAALKKQTDISLGNIIGSNLMNILAVIGLTGTVTPIQVEANIVNFDTPWMLGATLLLMILILVPGSKKITRWKGVTMVFLYLLYLYFIF